MRSYRSRQLLLLPRQQQQQMYLPGGVILRLSNSRARIIALALLFAACICMPLGSEGFPMDVTRNAELQQQKEQQLQQEQQLQRQEQALALMSLHEKYSPPNCKYHPLPTSLNSFGFLNNNGGCIMPNARQT